MHARLALFAIILGVGPLVAVPPDTMVVALRAEAGVAGPTVCVGDVADLRGGTAALRQRIGRLDLAVLGPEQPSVRLPRGQIAFRIQIEGVAADAFRVEGPEHVAVKLRAPMRDGNVVPAAASVLAPGAADDEIAEAAAEHLRKRLPWPADKVLVRLAQPVVVPPLDLGPADRVRLDAALGGQSALAGRVRVDVGVKVNEEPRAQVPVYFDVQIEQELAVAKQRIEPGEPLSAANLHADTRLLSSSTVCPTYRECLTDQRAKRRLAVGQVLTHADLEPVRSETAAVIHARDMVRIVTHVGPLRLSTMGEALQDGQAGQYIRVRNTASSRVILGRVVDRGVVEVEH